MSKEFLENYNKYKDKIYNFFWYRLSFNVTIAEDMTQEVFLKAFENYESFDSSRSFQAWVYAIAKNHLKNYYRVQGRETNINECEMDLAIDTCKEIEARHEWEMVLAKIKRLSPANRDPLLLRFVDGLSNEEIAEVMGCEEGAIRTRISRALKMIKESSENYD